MARVELQASPAEVWKILEGWDWDLSNAKGRGNNACSLNEIALVLEDVG